MLAVPVPDAPDVPPEQTAHATWQPRYEDVAQDGRLTVLALPPAIGAAVWRRLLTKHPGMRAANQQGIVPILTRLLVATSGELIRVDRMMEARGRFALARADRDGVPDRIFLNVWVDVKGTYGRIIPHVPAGDVVPAGAVFAEHVFTRPWAPRGERKLSRLDVPGFPAVPELVHEAAPPEATAELPPGATLLDDAVVLDDAVIVFGLDHTDANQHVNSLVYIRAVTDAALRRVAAHGRRGAVLARAVELAYRKPCFAGDRVRVALRAFATPDGAGAVGTVTSPDDPDGRPRAYARVVFDVTTR